MIFTQWLSQLSASKTQSSRATRRNKTPRPSSPRSVIKLEQLEDKLSPAILTVNSLLDNTTAGDGLVTLREAINAANNAGTVTDLGRSLMALLVTRSSSILQSTAGPLPLPCWLQQCIGSWTYGLSDRQPLNDRRQDWLDPGNHHQSRCQ